MRRETDASKYRHDSQTVWHRAKFLNSRILRSISRSIQVQRVIWSNAPVSGGYANELNFEAVPFLQAAGYFHTHYCWGKREPRRQSAEFFLVLKQQFLTDYLKWRNKVFSALGPYCDGNSCAGSRTGCVSEVAINSRFANLAVRWTVDL